MPRLTDFEVLSFDCYGTLIDWESGIWEALGPWLGRRHLTLGREEALEAYATHESDQEAAAPDMLYPEVLYNVHRRLASQWGVRSTSDEAMDFARSVSRWPAFEDSADALAYLGQHYRLVILSNIDRDSFAASRRRLGIDFEAVLTAEDIGSYKPDLRNFEYLLARLDEQGYGPQSVLHTAQSLYHDHVPANRLGLATCWIDRRRNESGWGATRPPEVDCHLDFSFASLAEMAAAHRAETVEEDRP